MNLLIIKLIRFVFAVSRKFKRILEPYIVEVKFSKYTGKDVWIHPDSYISGNVFIDDHTNINGPAYIVGTKNCPVRIGKYCAIGHNLRVRAADHNMEYANLQARLHKKLNFKSIHTNCNRGVYIGNNVWIGDNVIILADVTVGDGAVIGAGAVVTKDIPPFTIAVGIPAKVIKKRFPDDVIQDLLDIKWWDWPEDKIARNKRFFETDLTQPGVKIKKLIVE